MSISQLSSTLAPSTSSASVANGAGSQFSLQIPNPSAQAVSTVAAPAISAAGSMSPSTPVHAPRPSPHVRSPESEAFVQEMEAFFGSDDSKTEPAAPHPRSDTQEFADALQQFFGEAQAEEEDAQWEALRNFMNEQ